MQKFQKCRNFRNYLKEIQKRSLDLPGGQHNAPALPKPNPNPVLLAVPLHDNLKNDKSLLRYNTRENKMYNK